MSHLFAPITLGPLHLANRVIIPPMCQYSAQDGLAQDWHRIHYGQLAFSGAGLLIVEATAVMPEGRISDRDLGLWSDETEAALAGMVRSIRRYSSIPLGVQLGHAGRKASQSAPWQGGVLLSQAQGGWQTVAPSAIPYAQGDLAPKALDQQGIDDIVTAFAKATQRAARIGFDCVEMHAAHGYLLHEFLSPLSNTRTDHYGGSLENRMRLPLRVFEAMQSVLPAGKALGVRISAQDWVDGGWSVDESIAFTKELKKRGSAYIHVSSAGLSAQQALTAGPGYQVPFAERIKAATGVPTIAVGLITTASQAEEVLVAGKADMVAVGRAALFNPHWPWQAAAELGAQVDAPPQYWRAAPHGAKNLFPTR